MLSDAKKIFRLTLILVDAQAWPLEAKQCYVPVFNVPKLAGFMIRVFIFYYISYSILILDLSGMIFYYGNLYSNLHNKNPLIKMAKNTALLIERYIRTLLDK